MGREDFDEIWDTIYAEGRQQNKYPFISIVSLIFYLKKIINKNTSNIKILEVGCGTGNNLLFASENGFDCYGIDASEKAIEIAKTFFEKNKKKCNLKIGSFANLPYENNFFDLVIERAALTQTSFKVAKKAVEEINRVLKSDGFFYSEIFSDSSNPPHIKNDDNTVLPTKGPFVGVGKMTFYSKEMLLDLIKDFKIINLSHTHKSYLRGQYENFNDCHWSTLCQKLNT